MAKFLKFEAPTRTAAITAYIDARFGGYDANDQPTAPDVEAVRAWALSVVSASAETARSQYITTTPGKIGEYTQKREEFRSWRSAGSPDPASGTDYPIAAAESAAYGITAVEMLELWEQRSTAWSVASAQIAAAERAALLAIEAAENVAGITAALSGINFEE